MFFRTFFLNYLTLAYVKREGNKVSHYLAELVVNYLDNVIWIEDVPSSVFASVQVDLAIVLG